MMTMTRKVTTGLPGRQVLTKAHDTPQIGTKNFNLKTDTGF